MKNCTKCGELKDTQHFYKDSRAKSGFQSMCKSCFSLYQKTDAGKESTRKAHLKMSYNLTLEDYDRMYEEQGGCCAICGTHASAAVLGSGSRLAVDHNHETGEVRGLLCAHCNTALGKMKDSVSVLQSAINYLQSRGSYGKSSST